MVKTMTTEEIELDDDIWAFNDLCINDDGFVEGTAYTKEKDGYDIRIAVESYEYERHGETRMNHVPVGNITNEKGIIVHDLEPNDDQNAERAIENAVGSAEYAYKHLGQFID